MNRKKVTRFPALLCLAVGRREKPRTKQSKIFRTPSKNIYWRLIRWFKKGEFEKSKWQLKPCLNFRESIIFARLLRLRKQALALFVKANTPLCRMEFAS